MINPSILLVPLAFSTVFGALNVQYQWKYIDFKWRDPRHKQHAIDSGNYVPANIVTIDVDKAEDGRVFVTTPRDKGVPATLSTVTHLVGEGGPLLKPYPNWSWNSRTDCTGIISVYRVAIDKCNRLFVLDTGKSGENQICPAQLLIFNLWTDRLIDRIKIPSQYAGNGTGKGLLITPVVETEGPRCERTKVYMADVEGWGLVVWDRRSPRLRRYTSETFNAEDKYTNFTIAGESFTLEDGIFSLALQPKTSASQSTVLFYRSLASVSQYYVATDQLTGRSRNGPGEPNYQKFDYTFPTQVSIEAFSCDGILFFGYVGPTSIGCWNSNKPMNEQNVVVVAQDKDKFQFTSGMKVIREALWIMTNPYQKLVAGTLDLNQVNYRILVEPNVRNLVKGTNCEP